ncbi:MAG: argininosuccinate lyase [Acidimicrobiales bacterium]|jgi:argininosuccinate lyase
MTLWHGRLSGGTADVVMDYSVSLHFDRQLAHDDLTGSRAHVRGLGRGGLLSEHEVSGLLAALDQVEAELDAGEFRFEPGDEDIHTAVERRVTEIAGDVGAKLHTGRSRNDQIATDLRLYAKRELLAVASEIIALQEVLVLRSKEAGDIYLPGYTHLQRAQPVLLSHHLLAHGWALSRDVDRLIATVGRMDVSPLGAGALAGSSLPLDPDGVAEDLGFAGRFENSMDAVSDRDFVAEALFDLALLGVHLSRIGEEMVVWSTEEFGFAVLDDAFATGSSMLPQKKNPDVAELARGKTGRLIGNLTGLLVTLKGLPLSYNRDLQEDKEPLFDSVGQTRMALAALSGLLATVSFDAGRMQEAANGPAVAAVDLAEWLVEQGMPFRQAHGVVGGLVRDSIERHVPLVELVEAHPALGSEAVALLEPGVAVTRRTTPGSAGPLAVKIQLERFVHRLESDRNRIAYSG